MSARREQRIKHLSWTAFDTLRQETRLAIVPSGAIEVYGPHLPLGSDIIVAERVAALVAERIPCVIAPSVEIGDSSALRAFPGTLVTRPEHLKAVYADICTSLLGWGFDSFFFLNTHLGNVAPLDQLAQDLQVSSPDVRCAAIDWWRFLGQGPTDGIVETELPDGHASETGTSVLLHLAPEDVDMAVAPRTDPAGADAFPDVITYPPFDALTATGTLGDATAGTAEKGQRIVGRAVDRIVAFLEGWTA